MLSPWRVETGKTIESTDGRRMSAPKAMRLREEFRTFSETWYVLLENEIGLDVACLDEDARRM